MTVAADALAAGDTIANAFTEAQRRLERELAEILSAPNQGNRRRRIRTLLATIEAEMDALQSQASGWLTGAPGTGTPRNLADVYRSGATRTPGVTTGGFSFSQIHTTALDTIAARTFDDVLRATEFVTEDAKRWIREATGDLTARGFIEGRNPDELARIFRNRAPRAVTRTGQPLPITAVRYRNGNWQTLDAYGNMLFRTVTAQAYNSGTLNQSAAVGITRFELVDGADCGLTHHHDPTVANGTIVDAGTAQAYPISHPNCVRSIIPRPDLDPRPGASPEEIGRDVFAFDPSTTDAQRADQLATEQRRRQARQQNARSPRQRRRRRQSLDNLKQAEAARIERARAEAEAAAADIAKKRRAAQASRQASIRRVEKARAELLEEYDITAEQFLDAQPIAVEMRTDFRATLAEAQTIVLDRIAERTGVIKVRPPKYERVRDPRTGTVRRQVVGQGGEYDFLELLPEPELKRLRRDWFDESAPGIDTLLVNRTDGIDDIGEAVDQWLQDTRRHDQIKSLRSGRNSGWTSISDALAGIDTPILSEFADLRIDLDDFFGIADQPRQAAIVARAQADAIGEYAADVLTNNVTGQPLPIDMTTADYVAELTLWREDPQGELAAALKKFADPAAGKLTADEVYFLDRWAELQPPGIGIEATETTAALDPAEAHDRILYLARTHLTDFEDRAAYAAEQAADAARVAAQRATDVEEF